MYLDEMLAAQKHGEAKGIASICSAHPNVLRRALQSTRYPLIEATCNQVNQFGGYTGMTPADFVAFVRRIAAEVDFPFDGITLGGDHLGPHPWQHEPARDAMPKAEVLIAQYTAAGFTKLHLDCSMRLADDSQGPLPKEVSAARAAALAKVAERSGQGKMSYVIGTEVPRPGGVAAEVEGTQVSSVEDTRETIELHCKAFKDLGLEFAWERVIAVVVQPGVEFGDDFVLPYKPEAAAELSTFIAGQLMVYEAHSTDYQSPEALKSLVRDHFAILKVGPALTFAYREAIFALAAIEDHCVPAEDRSNILQVLENTMLAQPGYWNGYYRGTNEEQAFKRKFSLSDRVRYYWAQPEVQNAVDRLLRNLSSKGLPYSLLSQFVGETGLTARQVIDLKIDRVLNAYFAACEGR